jgi:hypothetical protein
VKAPTKEQLDAIVSVLSLAENHQMWTAPTGRASQFKAFRDEQYAAVNKVRDFVEANGVRTMRSILREAERSKANANGP